MNPTHLQFQSFERKHVVEMLAWRYPPPYEIYNSAEPSSEGAIENFMRPELNYMAVLNERDQMVAFRCFGTDAQVSGGDYAVEALDLGGGLRPDLTGKGLGRHIIAAAMNYAHEQFRPRLYRTTVASFNLRAKKVTERLGYKVLSAFVRTSDGLSFEIMVREAQMIPLSIPLRDHRQHV